MNSHHHSYKDSSDTQNNMFGKSKNKPLSKRQPTGSPGKRAYAIGDIHGRLDLLDDLLHQIEADNASRQPRQTIIVFLGDLIDRGPDSRGVVERLRTIHLPFAECYFVKGNHEESLTRGLTGEPRLLTPWLSHGGLQCVESYGLDMGAVHGQPDHVVEHTLMSVIPDSHIQFMKGFLDSIQFGDYLFVHAGVRPGVPIEQQSSKDMRWIRKEFLEAEDDFGCVVVHGHSISDTVTENHNRIGIDTGAYRTGKLTALRIEDTERSWLQTQGAPELISDANTARPFTSEGKI